MPKRRATDRLTGGTGDVNPQLMTIVADNMVQGISREVQAVTPVQRVGGNAQDSALVMEILKVFFEQDQSNLVSKDFFDQFMSLRTATQGSNTLDFVRKSGQTIAFDNRWFSWNSDTPDMEIMHLGQWQDLTDGQGHGVLVATDTIFFGAYAFSNIGGSLVTASGICKILYRLKEVGLAEYIGIVQSQSVSR